MGLPRDGVLRKINVALHGPRAFLASLLVVSQPEVVLGDAHGSLEGKTLANASRMAVNACSRLAEVLLEEPSPSPSCRLRRFRARLVMCRFARRYHAAAFKAWRAFDAERVASQMIGPYAEMVAATLQAQRSGNSALATAAQTRADQIRKSVRKLIGVPAADARLQEVEAAVRQQLAPLGNPTTESPPPQDEQPQVVSEQGQLTASSGPSGGAPRGAPAAPGAAAAAAAAGDRPAQTAQALGDSLVNEALAHELIMDPSFQLESLPEPEPFSPPSPTDFDPRAAAAAAAAEQQGAAAAAAAAAAARRGRSAAGGVRGVSLAEVQARVAATMQKVFWARLVSSLTPTTQRSASDFRVGSVVQARYGGPEGAFYEAVVTAVHQPPPGAGPSKPLPTFDIKYTQDGVVELGCPVSQFRLASQPVDARPLLSLVGEVRGRLERATPSRGDLHAKYREVLDAAWLTQMLQREGVLELGALVKLAHFLLDSLAQLEAPVRAQRTASFKDAFTLFVVAATTTTTTTTTTQPQPQPQPPPQPQPQQAARAEAAPAPVSNFVLALPAFFTFLHAALDQLQRDTVNFQLALLAPRFAEEAGVAYEARHFSEKLAKGLTTLQKTELWLGAAVKAFCEEGQLAASAPSSSPSPPPPPPPQPSVAGALPTGYAERKAALASSSAAGHAPSVRALVASALVDLIAKPVKWDSPEAASLIPETLVLDATSLAGVRDAVDRAVLVSTLVALCRQVLAQKRRVPLPPPHAARFQATLDDLLRSPNGSSGEPAAAPLLPTLQAAVVAAANAACVDGSGGTSSAAGAAGAAATAAGPGTARATAVKAPLSEADADYLRGLVASAADPKNAIFALFTKRTLGLIKRTALLPPDAGAKARGTRNGSAGGGGGAQSPALAALSAGMGGGVAGAGGRGGRDASGGGSGLGLRSRIETMLDEAMPATGIAPFFRESLLKACVTTHRIAQHNATVFSPHYSAIAQAHAAGLSADPQLP